MVAKNLIKVYASRTVYSPYNYFTKVSEFFPKVYFSLSQ